jgi:NAD+ synthase
MLNKEISQEVLTIREKIVNWLRNYLLESKKEGYILGLSGGVDSTVIALLAREAVERTGKKLLALILPINNDYYDEEMAVSVCKQFDINYKVINMEDNFNLLKSTVNNTASRPIVYTNLKARLRECAIYYYANNSDYLVLGTVNKGEFTIGYFPKNATAGDLLPIADLLKSEIREIGRSYGLTEEIVQRKASGCIWASTAEEEWGFTEEDLDMMLVALKQGEDTVRTLHGIPQEKKEMFLTLYKDSKHKRKFYPIFKKGG